MTTLLFSNNAQGNLAGAISNTTVTITLQTGQGALFPNPGAGQAFTATLIDAATGLINEIVSCTARSADTLTIVRGQEGTSARNWQAGDIFALQVTAGVMAAMQQAANLPANVTSFNTRQGAVTLTSNDVTTALGFTPSSSRNEQVYTAHGSFTWTVPAGVTGVYIRAVGAGGSGAGGTAAKGGGGGGAGGYTEGPLAVTPGQVLTIVVGTGGAAPSAGANDGNNGGNTTVAIGATTYFQATGGSGGNVSSSSAGGAPGVGSLGSLNLNGGFGDDGLQTAGTRGGMGGASYFGGGGRSGSGTGLAGLAPGSGGGGCYNSSGAGGAGADGAVTIVY